MEKFITGAQEEELSLLNQLEQIWNTQLAMKPYNTYLKKKE